MANTYNVFELQPQDPSFGTAAEAVNASGVAGGVVFQPQEFGTIWFSGTSPQSISVGDSLIFDVNDNGDAVGVLGTNNSPTQHAFLLSGGSIIDLFPTIPEGASGVHLNNNRLVVGFFGIGANAQGFVYDSIAQSPPTIIPPLPGLSGCFAQVINNNGVVAGLSGFDGSHGFLYSGGQLRDLGRAEFVEDINDSGIVSGSVGKPFPASFHAVICDTNKPNPSFTEIPLPPGSFIGSHGSAINNNGDVVGTCWTSTSFDVDQNAYIFSGGVPTDLNNLIASNSGWKLQFANDINDNGVIVGTGRFNGQQRGFLLAPVPNLKPILGKLLEAVGTIVGFQPIDGSGIIIVGGIPIPVGPWGPRVGDYAAKSDILISLALEELATHLGNVDGQIAIRRAALEVVRAQVEVLLATLNARGE